MNSIDRSWDDDDYDNDDPTLLIDVCSLNLA